jgi:death on curing protein
MVYLSKEQIVEINRHQVQTFGGNYMPPRNFLHEQNLDYLLEIIDSEMFGKPLYPELWHKAALYCFNIISNHIFQDGNKRTGLHASVIFLRANGFTLNADNDDLIAFATDVAMGKFSLEETQQWFSTRLQPIA